MKDFSLPNTIDRTNVHLGRIIFSSLLPSFSTSTYGKVPRCNNVTMTVKKAPSQQLVPERVADLIDRHQDFIVPCAKASILIGFALTLQQTRILF